MAHKRPCDNESLAETACKHPRQMENGHSNAAPCNGVSSDDFPDKVNVLGEGNLRENDYEGLEKPVNDTEGGHLQNTLEYNEFVVPRSVSLSPWASSATSDEGEEHELVVHMPFSPDYFSFDRPVRHIHSDDVQCYSLIDYPPRKLVPIGPDHQADIPELSNIIPIGEKNDGVAGICIISRSESDELSQLNSIEVGVGRADNCGCPDMGSLRCVKQHIAESRENLKSVLGNDAFKELGFYEMGEIVAERWSEEDQQLFHKVVYSNPASMGKNFWNILSLVFPARSHLEIVSYYFNVFILQKRAQQNRHSYMDIDSDNDEWHPCNDEGYGYDDDDGEKTDEEDGSAVNSPIHHHGDVVADACCHHGADGLIEHVEDQFHEPSPGFEGTEIHSSEGVTEKGGQNKSIHVLEKGHYDDSGDNDARDGSCTSFDSAPPAHIPVEAKPDCNGEWHNFILEPCDTKAWDGYSGCSRDEVDLLPTCNMIEEVFGDSSTFNLQSKSQ